MEKSQGLLITVKSVVGSYFIIVFKVRAIQKLLSTVIFSFCVTELKKKIKKND